MKRDELLKRNHPKLTEIDDTSPLSVGNGEFAFNVDVTGLQTFYHRYEEQNCPLCTMSNWGWHRTPMKGRYYSYEDLTMTEYDFMGRSVTYASKEQPGNEAVYHWLRQNPHRLNLGRIGFCCHEKEIEEDQISEISQELILETGLIESSFLLGKEQVNTLTVCDPDKDMIGVRVNSKAFLHGLGIMLHFPYGSPGISASDWEHPNLHETKLTRIDENSFILRRQLDEEIYYCLFRSNASFIISSKEEHKFLILPQQEAFEFSIYFSKEKEEIYDDYEKIFARSKREYTKFWNQIGMVDLHQSKDKRAKELERRIVLSEYLTKIQCTGSLPPQETGLTCNSWYGKFHLEMHPWHVLYLPLYQGSEYLEKSFKWYREILPKAKENAKRNGYKGARWPKMVAYEGIDSPSSIATLLIWQQPHILYMLELVYQERKQQGQDADTFLNVYYEIVKETADFMADYPVLNETTKCYDLCAPLIPAQEEFDPVKTKNPTFELAYWRFGLQVAAKWAERVKKAGQDAAKWTEVATHMAPLPIGDDVYLAHEACKDTFEHYHKDHPSMLLSYGFLPPDTTRQNENATSKTYVSPDIIKNTLKKVFSSWDFESMWGWDFALMAMTAVRLGEKETAIDILLKETPKNTYVASGNNYQKLRNDLPLYLPGNGSLLLAVALMTAGYEGCEEDLPGFPKNGQWVVEYENISKMPF